MPRSRQAWENAVIMNSSTKALSALRHIAFYKFVNIADPALFAARFREITASLTGSILLAPEGVNGMLAGEADAIARVQRQIETDPVFEAAFAGMIWKETACKTVPFRRMKVHVKKEIVPLGKPGVDATRTGIDVPPQEWRRLIDEEDVVLLDNRNSFEFRLGRFRNAIDPQVGNFRDFPRYVEEHIEEWKRDGKRVAMYCTGGIRCEKTSAWMQDMGVPVYQLQGGILNYFKEMPDAEKDWDGECFVFDNRIALDTRLEETGTTLEDVYDGAPDGPWRLARAKRLDEAG